MALPKLNTVPKYEMVIPSTNEVVKFRPFLVKEEKVLLIALESQDAKQIANSILDTVMACVEGTFDKTKLTSYDVEYMFLKIRAKSVGETTEVMLKCEKCEMDIKKTINLDDIKIDANYNGIEDISITDNIIVEMQHPSYIAMSKNEALMGTQLSTQVFGLIQESIVAVKTEEERNLIKDVKFEEFEEFIESMSQDQFEKIKDYVQGIPKLSHKVNYGCSKCNYNNEITLEGLQSFLS